MCVGTKKPHDEVHLQFQIISEQLYSDSEEL